MLSSINNESRILQQLHGRGLAPVVPIPLSLILLHPSFSQILPATTPPCLHAFSPRPFLQPKWSSGKKASRAKAISHDWVAGSQTSFQKKYIELSWVSSRRAISNIHVHQWMLYVLFLLYLQCSCCKVTAADVPCLPVVFWVSWFQLMETIHEDSIASHFWFWHLI